MGRTNSTSKTAPAIEAGADQKAQKAQNHQESGAWLIVSCWMLSLWVLLIPIRAQVMGFGWYWLDSPLQLGWMVLAGAYLDLLYVLVLGAIFLLLLTLTRRPSVRRLVRWSYALACVLSLLFALANIDVVAMVGHPLTYSWLYYSGFLRSYDAQKALAAGLTWGVVAGAGLCVVSLFALAWISRRCGALLNRNPVWRQWGRPAGLAMVVGYVALGAYLMRDFHRPSLQNPVIAFASSLVEGSDNRLFSVATSAPTADYETAGQRQDQPIPPQAEPAIRNIGNIKNVLVIVLESVPAQYLPVYGEPRPVTPCLDRYRDQSRVYRNIYAHAPATNKSLLSILCSMYPWPNYRFVTQEHPDAAVVSLSDVLHDRGYRTAFISAADLRFGNADGFLQRHQFDLVQDHRTAGGATNFKSNEPGHLDGTSDAAVCRSLIRWIQNDATRPFFATLWTNQTHYPYFTKSPLPKTGSSDDVRSALIGRYYQALQETDTAIGDLLGELTRLDLMQSTLVVIVGDHGEAFGQHGRFGHGNTVRELNGAPGGFGHGTALFEENIHVPLVLINPKLFAGEDDATLGGLVDVAPTILDTLHLGVPADWQGRSLVKPVDRKRVFFAAPWSGAVFGYREGTRKYLFDAINNSYKVFDLAQDPGEQTNLANTCSPEQFDEVYQNLAAWVQYQERLIRSVSTRGGSPQ